MHPQWLEQARVWLAKANSDLAAARLLIDGPEKYLDIGAYHCQQTAEKALKALLTAQGNIFPKTHQLEVLLDLALTANPNLEAFREGFEELTPLATEFRYPGDTFEPTLQQAQSALNHAQAVFLFVADILEQPPDWQKDTL